jgi:hypothetical protein
METQASLWEMKQGLFGVLKDLGNTNWNAEGQPWLNPPKSHRRTNTFAAQNHRRAGMDGKVRYLMASDLGVVKVCERRFSASYAGMTIKNDKTILNPGLGGTIFHKGIEARLPEWIQTETSNKNAMYVNLPSIGQMTQSAVTGKKKDGITGMMDGYLTKYETGLEIKSVPHGHEFPDDVPFKALGQAAGYAWGLHHNWRETRKPVRWVWLYLPSDMRNFNPHDYNTYKVFIKDYETELEPLFEDILERCRNVAQIVDEHGYWGAYDYLSCFDPDCYC